MFFNDISLTRYDIRLARMIYLLRKHDIISVPPYAEGIYHRTIVRYHIEDISPVPTGTDIIEKRVTKRSRIEVKVSESSVYYLAFFSISLISFSEYVLPQAAHKNSVQINLMFPIIWVSPEEKS